MRMPHRSNCPPRQWSLLLVLDHSLPNQPAGHKYNLAAASQRHRCKDSTRNLPFRCPNLALRFRRQVLLSLLLPPTHRPLDTNYHLLEDNISLHLHRLHLQCLRFLHRMSRIRRQ